MEKRWFWYPGYLSETKFVEFLNRNNIGPNEFRVIEHYRNFAGSGIKFIYYAEKELE